MAGNLDLPDPAKTLAAAYDESAAVKIDKPADTGATAFAYASTGAPGTVAERHDVADLGITQLRFANNVRVNLKKTDFEADKIHVLVQFGGGELDLPAGPARARPRRRLHVHRRRPGQAQRGGSPESAGGQKCRRRICRRRGILYLGRRDQPAATCASSWNC